MSSKIIWEKVPEVWTGGKDWIHCAYPLAPFMPFGYAGSDHGWIVGRVKWNRPEKAYQLEDFRVGNGERIGTQNFKTVRQAQKAFENWWKNL